MKKTMTLALAVLLALCLSVGAMAEQTALDAFNALVAADEAAQPTLQPGESCLDAVMAGRYAQVPTDGLTAEAAAADLELLCAITNKELAAYASSHGLKAAQVRNAYFKALANALKAEIMVNPASEEKYRNVQMILSLFLEPEEAAAAAAAKQAIRSQMSPEYSEKIAQQYDLPTSFVEFVIMNDDWDDDDWENDDDWRDDGDWNALLEDAFEDITIGSRDSGDSARIADLQEALISLGYLKGKADGVFGPRSQSALLEFQLANALPASGIYTGQEYKRLQAADVVARWDYDDDFWDSDDFDSYNSPNTPDTPDARDTADSDTPDSPDTPDKPKASSAKKKSGRKDSPDTPDSPDSPDTPKQSAARKSTAKKSAQKKSASKKDSPDSPDSPD